MKKLLLVLMSVTLTGQDSKISYLNRTDAELSAWTAREYEHPCGPISAVMYSEPKGWHEASCMEIADKLGALRDVSRVTISMPQSVGEMLAYSQYEQNFRITHREFTEAQAICKDLLKEGFAVSDILKQCRETVAGKVPYGLKLAGQ